MLSIRFCKFRTSMLPFAKYLRVSPLINWHRNARSESVLCSSFAVYFEQKRFIISSLIQEPATGFNLPGQGLKKVNAKELRKLEDESIVLRFCNRQIAEQEKGLKKFPTLPDYKFFFRLQIFCGMLLLISVILYPDVKSLVLSDQEQPLQSDVVIPEKPDSAIVYVYLSLPLRVVSRLFGRITDLTLIPIVRGPAIKAFSKLTGANPEEALVTDLSQYKSIGEFFRRPINLEFRPIDEKAELVSPVDGKVLVYGSVNVGKVEQVKGVTYSLQKFLGPIKSGESNKKSLSLTLPNYEKAIMRDPENNNLYQCVIYLAPHNYHGFHSPSDWVVKRRRHFPGDLLSVNPKIAKWVQNLFVLNERVVLSGEWQHGFFSMTAIGATNVGSIKIHDDLLLKTNQVLWKRGSYYDFDLGQSGKVLEKGEPVGEFNLGSTVVLIFEAPKDFKFNLENNQSLKFGENITSISEKKDAN